MYASWSGGLHRGRDGRGVDDADGACVAPPSSRSAGVGAQDEALEEPGADGVDLAELASINDALQKSIDFNEIHVSEVLSTETTGGHKNFVVAMLPVYAADAQDFLVEQPGLQDIDHG